MRWAAVATWNAEKATAIQNSARPSGVAGKLAARGSWRLSSRSPATNSVGQGAASSAGRLGARFWMVALLGAVELPDAQPDAHGRHHEHGHARGDSRPGQLEGAHGPKAAPPPPIPEPRP